MFPDRIMRLLIDGVANAHDYYIGRSLAPVTLTSGSDSKRFSKLHKQCFGLGAGVDEYL